MEHSGGKLAHHVVLESELLAPGFDVDPLGVALSNTDEFYQHWRPALISQVHNVDPKITRQSRFEIMIAPSADGISYDFEHVVEQTSGTGTLSVTVEIWTGASWSTIESTTGIAFSGKTTHTHSDVISASGTICRITYTTSDGATNYTAHSVIAVPSPSAPSGGVLASGFRDYDSGLLGATGAPLNTELLNRAPHNVAAVVNDRRALVLSFGQEDSAANVRHDVANGWKPDAEFALLGYAVASIPYASAGDTVDLVCKASVDAGATSNLVRVSEDGEEGAPVYFAADGARNEAPITIHPRDAGTLNAHVVFRVEASNTSGNTTYVHNVVGFYDYELPASWEVIKGPTPPAALSALAAAVRIVENWAFRPWPQPALCFEGNTTDLISRRLNASIGLGAKHARAWITRCFAPPGFGAVQSSTVIQSDSSGGFGGGADDITVPAETSGNEVYLEATASVGQPWITRSGDLVDDSPSATSNRQIELTEGLSPTIETIDVSYCAGFGLAVVDVTADRESL